MCEQIRVLVNIEAVSFNIKDTKTYSYQSSRRYSPKLTTIYKIFPFLRYIEFNSFRNDKRNSSSFWEGDKVKVLSKILNTIKYTSVKGSIGQVRDP